MKAFHAAVYRLVRRIPRGRVATYGQIAALAGLPGRARQVGYALYASPPGGALPWHRVLGAGGALSLAKIDPSAAITQRLRLVKEGVRFTARGRVDLEASGWRPQGRSSVSTTTRRVSTRPSAKSRAK